MARVLETEFGHARLDPRGYYTLRKTINGKRLTAYLHVEIYKRHFGNIPRGWVVHHVDGVKTNNDIDNLEAMSQKDHIRVHKGWIKTNNQWTHKLCSMCNKIKDLDSFGLKTVRSKSGKLSKTTIHCCRPCSTIRKRVWREGLNS